ncbi:helix-turn-helix domain-containing protein [Deinococcus sp. UR1]|uniref:helix-turn-helix domain-containing protein n=1 Tax=Deinococcus sp. UR1 TaxID=1704277 RepID=UPI000A3ECE7A|nr:helix-turn-helix transcriptional regulator [Deinococcus sp. UR1]PIG98908.1 transcriptional regulator [Deinococcus sp. UR1]
MFNLDRLKSVREEKKLTQQQLSDLSGIPIATIQKQEQGIQKDASLSIAAPLAAALGVAIEDLYSIRITSKNVNDEKVSA